MDMNYIGSLANTLNPFVVYGLPALLTLGVILHRARVVTLPRPLVLICWYSVVGLASMWLLFHIIYYTGRNPRDSGLVTIARIIGFAPVYLCAVILLFIYPKKPPSA